MKKLKTTFSITGIFIASMLFLNSLLVIAQQNTPPDISMITPSNNGWFPDSANITISAFADDFDGTVTKVEFYNGTTKIGEDSISEYGIGVLPKHWHETKGFGTDTKGGIEGEVYKVTNLDSIGPGSLRDAVSESNRLVVFEVGGVIEGGFSIIADNVTIAGQTAPYPGITIIKGSIYTFGSNIVVSHITHHMGSEVNNTDDDDDAWKISGSNNIVLDHVAVYWGTDETLPIHNSVNVTIFKSIIAEGLQFTGHEDGEHSKGLWLDHDNKISVIGSLGAHNALRNPRLDGGEAFLANYVVYNWGTGWDHYGDKVYSDDELPGCTECFNYAISARMDADVTLVGSVALSGLESKGEYFLSGHYGDLANGYLEDNIIKDREGNDLMMADPAINLIDLPSIWPEGMVPLPAEDAVYEVLRTVGPQPGNRNEHNLRIAKDVAEGTGEIIDSETEVGGYPNYPATHRSITVPEGAEARQAWLDSLENEMAVDTSIDLSRLYTIVGSLASDKTHSGPKYTCTWNNITEGTYTITAVAIDSDGAETTSSPVTIVVGNIVKASPDSAEVSVGMTTQLTATVSPYNASNKTVNWSSNNTTIATVSSEGTVKGISAGSAIITCTTEDGRFEDSSLITIKAILVTSISVTPETASVNVGETIQLKANISPFNATNKTVNWKSNNPSVATISTTGIVLGIEEGSATMIATSENGGYSDSCLVAVSDNTSSTADYNNNSKDPNSDLVTYPNPVGNQLKIILSNDLAKDASIEIFDYTGRKVFSMKSTGKENSIDLENLSSGMYLIKVSDNENCIVQQIIKK